MKKLLVLLLICGCATPYASFQKKPGFCVIVRDERTGIITRGVFECEDGTRYYTEQLTEIKK